MADLIVDPVTWAVFIDRIRMAVEAKKAGEWVKEVEAYVNAECDCDE